MQSQALQDGDECGEATYLCVTQKIMLRKHVAEEPCSTLGFLCRSVCRRYLKASQSMSFKEIEKYRFIYLGGRRFFVSLIVQGA